MSKYVPDILSRRWVILSTEREHRPRDQSSKKKNNQCPFCPGNENLTPKEILRVPNPEDSTAWLIRVVDNKYPITDFHEVIIHSPDHCLDIETLPQSSVTELLRVYKKRFNSYRDKGQVIIFCNHECRRDQVSIIRIRN